MANNILQWKKEGSKNCTNVLLPQIRQLQPGLSAKCHCTAKKKKWINKSYYPVLTAQSDSHRMSSHQQWATNSDISCILKCTIWKHLCQPKALIISMWYPCFSLNKITDNVKRTAHGSKDISEKRLKTEMCSRIMRDKAEGLQRKKRQIEKKNLICTLLTPYFMGF